MVKLLLVFLLALPAFADVTDSGIANFKEVTHASLYRGGQPDEAGFEKLRHLGIKTIIKLNEENLEEEVRAARRIHANLVYEPISFFEQMVSGPSDAAVWSILRTLRDPSAYPIFIHCEHGQDRTGEIVGLDRSLLGRWTRVRAHEEMLRYGFHKILFGLEHDFWERTE